MSISSVLAFAREKNLPVTGLTFRSQEVAPGMIFFALKGANADGNKFIPQAIERHAVMIVSSVAQQEAYPVPYMQSDDIDRDMADAAYEFYRYPSDSMSVTGITGTKGKTSIAYLLESVLRADNRKTGVFGTVNYRIDGTPICSAPNTTPAALTLFKLLGQMRDENCQEVVMEVSSHALEQQRVRHIWYDTAVFTNLQRDHLDYHHTFENYFQAKYKLFENLTDSKNPKKNRTAVINIDDPYGRRLAEEFSGKGIKIITYGMENPADFSATDIREFLTHTSFKINGKQAQINLLGRHNVYNALAAWACAAVRGIGEEKIIQGLAALSGVAGRMERIDEGQDFFIFVDFAYTDESLQKAFDTVRPFCKGRILTVFGCGGQRDTTKRPLMGRTACINSDYVFLTNDNPRCEDPQQIFNDILKGMDGFSNYRIIADRSQAIKEALASAQKDDVVIIAGKGHEDYQIIGTEKHYFSDQETVRDFLRIKNV